MESSIPQETGRMEHTITMIPVMCFTFAGIKVQCQINPLCKLPRNVSQYCIFTMNYSPLNMNPFHNVTSAPRPFFIFFILQQLHHSRSCRPSAHLEYSDTRLTEIP